MLSRALSLEVEVEEKKSEKKAVRTRAWREAVAKKKKAGGEEEEERG